MIDKKSCAVCAWREDCQKRFTGGDELALRCPEFTFDIRLKKKVKENEEHKGPDKGKGESGGK